MAPVGVGILGAAAIARKNCRALAMTDQLEVVAVGSRDQARAQRFIEECGLAGRATAHGSYEDVLSDPSVEAVYVPLPTTLHLEWVRRAAAAGKHVLLEKPIATTPEETDAMVAACADAGVQLMDGTMWMHNPRTARMEARLADVAAVGQLLEVHSVFSFAGSDDFLATNIRTRADCDPLGALGDLGWYCVRAILWAFRFEAPTSLAAHAGATFTPEGVPLSMGATLVFPGGRRGHFDCSFDRALTQTLHAAGTAGTVWLDDFVIPRDERKCSYVVSSCHGLRELDTYDATQREETTLHLERPQEVDMWERFARCVRDIKGGGAPDQQWPRIAANTQKLLCAVLQSARAGGAEVQLSAWV